MKKNNENKDINLSNLDDNGLREKETSLQDIDKSQKVITDKQKKKLKLINKASRTLDYIVLILSLIALFIGVYALWDTHKVLEISSSEEYSVYKPDSRDNFTFEDLKKINPDVNGWIDVYGTKIDYPIVQGEDNWEYLNKTVHGDFSTGGSIFLDYRNKSDFTDFQNILYGHYMAKRKMFGDIELYKDEKFFDSHRYGVIHRDGQSSLGIEFFAYLSTVGTDQEILSPAKLESDKSDLIEHIYKEAIYSRKIDFNDNESIVVLDTCDLSKTNGRYILIGRLTEDVKENVYKEEIKENQFSKLISKTYKMNLLLISLVSWGLLVLIYLIYELIRHKKKTKEAKSDVQNNRE